MELRAAVVLFFLFFCTNISSIPSSRYDLIQNDLDKILINTANYCERLKEAAFHFNCEETITENQEIKEFVKEYKKSNYSLNRSGTKNIYVNDYRIIKDGDNIVEHRTPLLQNGKKIDVTKPGLKTAIMSFKSSLAPYYLFAGANKKKYNYRVLKKEKVMKRTAYVVQVDIIKKYNETPRYAIVWIDASDFSILKFRAFPQSIKGYDTLENSGDYDIGNLEIEDTHYFNHVKKGLRFPSKTEITLIYTYDSTGKPVNELMLTAGSRMLKKIKTTFEYKKYIFFSVTVTEPVLY